MCSVSVILTKKFGSVGRSVGRHFHKCHEVFEHLKTIKQSIFLKKTYYLILSLLSYSTSTIKSREVHIDLRGDVQTLKHLKKVS